MSSPNPFQTPLDAWHAQLRSALDDHVRGLNEHLDQAVADARQEAALEAEQVATAHLNAERAEWQAKLEEARTRWTDSFDTARAEWEAKLDAEVAARTEAERRLVTEVTKARFDAEQQAAEAASHTRAEVERALAAERERFEAALQEERQRLTADLETVRRQASEAAEALAAERHGFETAVQAMRDRVEGELAQVRNEAREAADARAAGEARAQAEREQLQSELQLAQRARDQAQAELDRLRDAHHLADVDAEQVSLRSQQLEKELQQSLQHGEQIQSELQRAQDYRERIQAELQRAHDEIESTQTDLQRALADLADHQQRRESDLESARAEAVSAADRAREAVLASDTGRVVERQEQLEFFERLSAAMGALDSAGSLTRTLDALVEHAAKAAPRVALFLLNGTTLKSWRSAGFPDLERRSIEVDVSSGDLLAHAVTGLEAIGTSPGQPGPEFAGVPVDRAGLAQPLMVGGQAVGVLYADNVGPGAEAPASWPEMIDALARHAAALLALHTATRTMQALTPGRQVARAVGTAGATGDEDTYGARRYARLLVSEIKLYNESAVATGRQHGDLLNRLRPEIERARRLYEERVSSLVAGRALYFQQELVQTLAGGDPALLGNT